MLFFMKAIDPTLESVVVTYTDTHSTFMVKITKNYWTCFIKPKAQAQLGYLCSDIDNEESNLAPKTYFYENIDNTGKLKIDGDPL